MRRTLAAIGVTAILSVAGACAGPSGHGDDDDTSYNCAAESRDDEFVVGLEKPGASGRLTFTLMAASPAPPSRGDNTWTLQLAGGGDPVGAAAITVTPFMPDHQHGTPIEVGVTAAATAGEYMLAPVNMWMPGLWEITIDAARTAGADGDHAVFRFCIPS